MGNQDIFAASWWQRTERFLALKAIEEKIKTVEDDAFMPILNAGNGWRGVRMSRDHLDFCVEHLSKWWKTGGGEVLSRYAPALLANYTERMRAVREDSFMTSTLAVVPYGVTDRSSATTKALWEASLSATLSSLLKHGIARAVVVGYYDNDEELARRAFETLCHCPVPEIRGSFEVAVGASELAFVRTQNVSTKFIKENVPKGALVDLQAALAGRAGDARPLLGKGPKERFRYVLLNEADQILNARITAEFLSEMDGGNIIVPHRAQPFLHPRDVRGLRLDGRVKSIPEHKAVLLLDAAKDSCCDTGYHQDNYQKACRNSWFLCDYDKTQAKFAHLDEYSFVSLVQGTGVVLLAGNQHSRRCQPMPGGRGKC